GREGLAGVVGQAEVTQRRAKVYAAQKLSQSASSHFSQRRRWTSRTSHGPACSGLNSASPSFDVVAVSVTTLSRLRWWADTFAPARGLPSNSTRTAWASPALSVPGSAWGTVS